MQHPLIESLYTCLEDVVDPRIERRRLHNLEDLIIIAVLAVIAGADDFEDIHLFGRAQHAWLSTFLDLSNGIPSTSTFQRLFRALDPIEFEAAFMRWLQTWQPVTPGQVIAIDGKTMRRSHDRSTGLKALHVVSAWAHDQRLVIGQQACEEKSNEITAIPALLDRLMIKGCVVTTDAMGCQKAIAQKLRDKHADYFLHVKGNHPTLEKALEDHFSQARCVTLPYATSEDDRHGREEERCAWVSTDIQAIKGVSEWPDLKSVILVESERRQGGKRMIEYRHYISSLGALEASRALEIARGHWGIENQLHWVLDVIFKEDDSRQRRDNAARNFAQLRKWVLNLLRQEPSKGSLKGKRKRAGWDPDFMLSLLHHAASPN